MAWRLRSAAAVVARSARIGVLSRPPPTQQVSLRRHVHDGSPLDLARPRDLRLDPDCNKKLEGTTMNMIFTKRDLVIECTQSLISDRQKKIGGNNIWKGWRVAAVTLAGFMSGNYISLIYHEKYEKPRLRQERKTCASSGCTCLRKCAMSFA